MAHKEFPKWVHGADGASKLVGSQKELDELEGDWHESPADVPKDEATVEAERKEAAAQPPEMPMEGGPRDAMAHLPPGHVEHDRLMAEAEAVGLKVDKRWSDERLRREILEHAST